ncbi:unnamed protein product [Vitrella brassicaformis CCMP3155]|uniref:Ubiquitin-like domain-containing protein n=1 Tax=Vitrella brassicaformis (strain CCMP3155) TaxID=1169540 RepID=A0A0G4EC68_VITBC|nr:unnamed protein product [Vitrella brassicaformis CCMP3155]|eukprot:CEL93294.1 unnamed protein product [Vitrella brassicaformis CCMP3155]
MAPKKKGKKKKEKDEDVPDQPQYEHPEVRPARLDERRIKAVVKLAAPVCSLLEFVVDVTPRTKIGSIGEAIIARHGGSIRADELSICVNRFHPEEVVSSEKTLADCGVVGGEALIYYDFMPQSGPLLGRVADCPGDTVVRI